MRKYSLAIVFVLSFLFSCFNTPVHSTLTQSATLFSQGTIDQGSPDHIPNGLILKYSTDFGNVTKRDDSHFNNFGIANYEWVMAGSGAFWIEGVDRTSGPTPHSGTRCLGIEVPNPVSGQTHRSQLNMYVKQANLVGPTYYYSFWMYLPANFQLAWLGWGSWCSLNDPTMNLNDGSGNPKGELMIQNMDSSKTSWKAGIEYTPLSGQGGRTYQWYDNFPLPLGRWFKVEASVDLTTGNIKVWMDGIKIVDWSGLSFDSTNYYIAVAKLYFDGSDTIPKKLWVDDIEIWG